jgi:hypothetical protein
MLAFSLVLCYSHEETAEYIEHFRLCERKTPESVIASIKQYNKKNRWNRNRNDGGEFAAEKGKIEQVLYFRFFLLDPIIL